MKSVQSQGYSKEKALEASGLNVELEMLKNATQAWKKAGSPLKDKEMNKFMAGYLKDKKAVGAYIVVDGSSDDTRLRPYSVINQVTDGKRKAKTTYQIKEAEIDVKYHTEKKITVDKDGNEKEVEFQTPYIKETITIEVENEEGVKETKTKEIDVPQVKITAVGAVVAKADKKDLALKAMKELIEANKRDYVIEICKEIVEGQKYAGYGIYTPSKSAKQGTFVFFVAE